MSELPNLPFAVFDEFGKSCEDRVADHYRAAVQAAQPEAVGEPVAWHVNHCGSCQIYTSLDSLDLTDCIVKPLYAAAPTEAKPDESLFNLLFAVEQAANNGALHWEVEEAFRAYEASKAAVMHKPSGFTFDQVIACATPDDLMPLTAQIHPTTEPDCSGGIACTTCPDKRKCQRGCIRQGEALENPDRKDLRAECDAVDALLRGLGLDPERCRTEGGALNVGRTLSLLADGVKAKPAKADALNTLCKMLHSGEEVEGDDGLAMLVPMDLWNEAQEAIELLVVEDEAIEAKPAQDAVDAETGAPSPEQEEWVMDLAQKHNLGRRVGQIGTLQGVSPDVFYTDASYRTQELFDFAAELLASSELNADQRRALVGNWFAEDWAVHQALGLLDDYDTERAAISAKKGGA